MVELYELGILHGVGGGLSAPDRPVTRAEVCVFLCRLLNIPPENPPPSAPAEIRNHWAAPHLWSAVRHGLLEGDRGVYRPEDRVTRAELAQFCLNAAHLPNTIDFSQNFYQDVAPPAWYNNAVVTMRVFGLMTGMPDGTFRPYGGATRAETAAVIHRMLGVERKDFTRPPRSRQRIPAPYITDPR
jgi:hypothetical protein